MHEQSEQSAFSHLPFAWITADHMLAAARKLERYWIAYGFPPTYRLHIYEDGSLHWHETHRWSIGWLSLEEVNIAVYEMYGRDRSIPLWQKLTTLMW